MLDECEWQVEDKSEGLLPLLMLGYVSHDLGHHLNLETTCEMIVNPL
jgi:hypothetical protein